MKKWSETYVNNYKEKHKSEEKINPKCKSKVPHYPIWDCYHEDKLLEDDLLWVLPSVIKTKKVMVLHVMCTSKKQNIVVPQDSEALNSLPYVQGQVWGCGWKTETHYHSCEP